MNFESDGLKVTQSLDPNQGPRYTKLAQETLELDVID